MNVLGVLLVLLAVFENTFVTNGSTVGDVVRSFKNIGQGLKNSATDLVPEKDTILQAGKQALGGYSFEVLSSIINEICSAALSNDAVQPRVVPDLSNMTYLLMLPGRNYSYPLTRPDLLWQSEAFDKSKSLVVHVTGWTTDVNEANPGLAAISKAYFCRGNVNYVAVDTAHSVDTLYTWSAFNTEMLGENIGKSLALLTGVLPPEKIHLIGHSLGAHIVGSAGRQYTFETGKQIGRITGLDPAKPCFNSGETLEGLERGDATFVDIIHSNPGVLGKRDILGDVDFYPSGLDPLQPGCNSIWCSHARAWEYYAESVYPGNERNFLGSKCNSLTKLINGACRQNPYPMGYAVPLDLKGTYMLEVNSKKPYGKNARAGSKSDCIRA